MDRYWLLTTTCSGVRLPGDGRGFVSRVRDQRPEDPASAARIEHKTPDSPYAADLHGLHRAAREQLKCPPLLLRKEQATVLLEQFQETGSPPALG